jgi:hypothetical protein
MDTLSSKRNKFVTYIKKIDFSINTDPYNLR